MPPAPPAPPVAWLMTVMLPVLLVERSDSALAPAMPGLPLPGDPPKLHPPAAARTARAAHGSLHEGERA